MNKRFTVDGADGHGYLMLRSPFGEPGEKPLPRPIVGSSQTGLHSTPPAGAQVLALYEDGLLPYPSATHTATDSLGALPAQGAGETAIYAVDGSTLVWARASGPHTLYRSPDGSFTVTVDGTLKRLVVTGGTIWQGSTQVTVP